MQINKYIQSLRAAKDSEYPGIIGGAIAVRNKCGFIEMRTVVGIFEDDNLADNQLVFLLDNGKYIIKRYDEMRNDIIWLGNKPNV